MINQNYNSSSSTESVVNIGTIMLITRLFITLVGLGITLFGIKYSLDIFMTLYQTLQKPETLTAVIEKWTILLNIKGFIVADYPLDKLLAIVILAVGVLLLLRITLGFIQAGISMLINSANVASSVTGGDGMTGKAMLNLDYKLNKLKSLFEQGVISKQAYENARDRYWVQKIMND